MCIHWILEEEKVMNVCLIDKKTGECENIVVFENIEIAKTMCAKYVVTGQVQDFGMGDIFKDGKWEKGTVSVELELPQQTIEEQLTELQLAVAEVYEKIAR